jgi:glutathione synthase/RimK-type ligase-like ATP-grasp enzyme
MILLIGHPTDEMVERAAQTLAEMGEEHLLVYTDQLPSSNRFSFSLPDLTGEIQLVDGSKIDLREIKSIYHRVGFSDYEMDADFSAAERQFVNNECNLSLNAYLNNVPCLVVNRPVAAGSNASKPYQIQLIQQYGFEVPQTLVTSLPESAREFFESLDGRVIYKSVSFNRSIVQRMHPDDLDRLDLVRTCPVQFQEAVEGTDIRVHVVGDEVFASAIEATESDYRYDKGSAIEPTDLPEEIADRCRALNRGLGFAMSGIDLRVTPDERYYCFEVNPSPAFTWYENRTEQPIARALCELLVKGES